MLLPSSSKISIYPPALCNLFRDWLAHHYSSTEHFLLGLHYTGDEGVPKPAKMATSPYLGCMSEYKPETESVSAYQEMMDIFLQANEFPEEKRVSIFLSLRPHRMVFRFLVRASPTQQAGGWIYSLCHYSLLSILQVNMSTIIIIIYSCTHYT